MITTWNKIEAWFRDSVTILWARIPVRRRRRGRWAHRGVLGIRLHAAVELGHQVSVQDAGLCSADWRDNRSLPPSDTLT